MEDGWWTSYYFDDDKTFDVNITLFLVDFLKIHIFRLWAGIV